MKIKDCIVIRLKILCDEKNWNPNQLAVSAGVTPSTVYSIFDSTRHDISINTLKKLCDGLDISLADFFNDSVFDNNTQEIR